MADPDRAERLSVATADDLPAGVRENVRAILAYWVDSLDGRRMPQRADFDPMDLPSLLPGLMLIDVEGLRPDGLGIYRYRVVGGYEIRNRGYNPTGQLVEEGFFAESLESALADYERVRKTARPLFGPVTFVDDRHRRIDEESILLPYSEDGETVSQILVFSERQVRSSETTR